MIMLLQGIYQQIILDANLPSGIKCQFTVFVVTALLEYLNLYNIQLQGPANVGLLFIVLCTGNLFYGY